MTKHVRLINLFLSSPSDVEEERRIVHEVASEINRLRGRSEGFRIEVLAWEHDVRPAIGVRPQEHISAEIGNDYDIFVGIMCARFGTPTGTHNSGTEEEFDLALAKKNSSSNSLEILLYFKDPRFSTVKIDSLQFLKVEEFKKKVNPLGYYFEFTESENFRSAFRTHLSTTVTDTLSNTTQSTSLTQSSPPMEILGKSEPNDSDEDEDLGVFDILERVQSHTDSLVEDTEVLTAAMTRLTGRIEERTRELRGQLGGEVGARVVDQATQKRIALHTARHLNDFSGEISSCLPRIATDFGLISDFIGQAVIISKEDGLADRAGALQLDSVLEGLTSVLSSTAEKLDELANTIARTPRMVRELNVARRIAVGHLRGFRIFAEGAVGQIEVVRTHLSDMLDK